MFKLKAVKAALYPVLKKKSTNYHSEDNKMFFEDEGNKEYIELQKKRFESFMFGEYKELCGDKYGKFKNAVNDRLIQKVRRMAHKHKDAIKNNAIKAALDGNDVLGFFTGIGLFITWEVKDGKSST